VGFSLVKLDLGTTHPMFGWLTGFWQVFFVTAVFCLWNKIRSSNMNCHGLMLVQMSTMTACNETTFKGNLFIMLVGLCIVWLTPIYKRIVYNEYIRQQQYMRQMEGSGYQIRDVSDGRD